MPPQADEAVGLGGGEGACSARVQGRDAGPCGSRWQRWPPRGRPAPALCLHTPYCIECVRLHAHRLLDAAAGGLVPFEGHAACLLSVPQNPLHLLPANRCQPTVCVLAAGRRQSPWTGTRPVFSQQFTRHVHHLLLRCCACPCCREKAVTIDGHVDVPKHNETALMQSVSHTVSARGAGRG